MITLISLFFLVYFIAEIARDCDREAERRNDYIRQERRHREIVSVIKPKPSKKTTRTIAKDEQGRVIAQEIIEVCDE